MDLQPTKIGLIAGNGDFPFFILDECRRRGIDVVVAAIKGETHEGVNERATKVQWMGVGQIGKLIRFFKKEKVGHALMVGHVQHVRIFGKDYPDLRMLSLLARIPRRNTDSILTAIANELLGEGIQILDSTLLLRNFVPEPGVMTKRGPDKREMKDIQLGRQMATEIARLDIGQTVVVRDQAVVAVEAMEGTDAAIERGANLCQGKKIVVVKVSKPRQDMRFDVPVIGCRTIDVLKRCNVSAIAVDAGKSLIFQKEEVIRMANEAKITMVAFEPGALELPPHCL